MFAGWILQAGNFVQIVMIKLLVQRLERPADVGEIDDPAFARPNRAAHVHLNVKRVTVQPVTLVFGRHVRQPMGSLEGEDLKYFHERKALRGDAAAPRWGLAW